MTQARNPRLEAGRILSDGHEARVLEPSPPADVDPNWFADDPTDPAGATATTVTPIPGEGATWTDVALDRPDVAGFAADHWLDGRRRPVELPAGYDATRRNLHQVAFFAVAPTRFAATGKLGLRYTHRGFGTPFFKDGQGRDTQIRIEADQLLVQTDDTVRSQPITTLSGATAFLGIDYREVWFDGFHDPLAPLDPGARLDVDPAVTEAVGAWFGFTAHVLERARRTPGATEVSRVQLWPEHFDPAFEMGDAAEGRRASYGASPGDQTHPEPYLYVAAWGTIDRSDHYWNDPTFNGASLSYRDLLDAEDPYSTAITFYQDAHRRLTE